MDTLRGNFGSVGYGDDDHDYDNSEDETGRELPPVAIGTDERRMQVRAYNHWASLLDDRNFPSIEDLDPENLNDFGPYSVLLDFTSGIEDPAVQYLGKELAGECGTEGEIAQLSDVPSRSLLSRITDHYMQILANQAPIGFEAEFVNQRDATILYRGILLPYSSDGDTIDFIYGVINWKEMADQITADELLLEIDQVLEANAPSEDDYVNDEVADWADGPTNVSSEDPWGLPTEPEPASDLEVPAAGIVGSSGFPAPAFGEHSSSDLEYQDDEGDEDSEDTSVSRMSSLIQPRDRSKAKKVSDLDLEDWEEENDFDPLASMRSEGEEDGTVDLNVEILGESPLLMKKTKSVGHGLGSMFEKDEHTSAEDRLEESGFEDEDFTGAEFESEAVEPATLTATETHAEVKFDTASDGGLHDCLAEARELAHLAHNSEERTRAALYDAVGRAYDVSIAAIEAPDEFAELVSESGLSVQERAPMTPVVKLVFGANYDKTRLTEYAAVLQHAQRVGIERGGLSRFLSEAEGGLKGVVETERRFRKEESGKAVAQKDAVRPALAKKLRDIGGQSLDAIDANGPEFGVVLIRRLESGEIVLLGEVSGDIPLIEKVARKIIC